MLQKSNLLFRWLFESKEKCKDSEFCYSVPTDNCEYNIKPIGDRKFGAEITGIKVR